MAFVNGEGSPHKVDKPTNPMVSALLSDLYQFTMAYAYWKAAKHLDFAVFDLLHRKNPFGGEYTIFAGLEECIRFTANFHFEDSDVEYLKKIMPPCEDAFFEYLKSLDCSDVQIYAIPEGSVVFPRIPLMRIEGPLLICQLLETAFLNLVNYASLVTTNAARHRQVSGATKMLLNLVYAEPRVLMEVAVPPSTVIWEVLMPQDAGRRFGIPVRGTHSHAFVSSFLGVDEITKRALAYSSGDKQCDDFVALVGQWLKKLQDIESFGGLFSDPNRSELAAFTSYALAFPTKFQALVDTFDVLRSGVPNFCAVALALNDLGYKALGVRLDSGDLAYLSKECRKIFGSIEEQFNILGFRGMVITASNDLNEETIDALNKQGHEIDAYGVGTHLVTCSKQPALGGVYKLVEVNKKPRMKLSQDIGKVTIPCKKEGYRLYGVEGYALVDILKGEDEPPPKAHDRILCRHPFIESKRAFVIPQKVEKLYRCYWAGKSGVTQERLPSLEEIRNRCREQLAAMRPDHLRGLNPTPYKVSVSGDLYKFIHTLWLSEAPIGELR